MLSISNNSSDNAGLVSTTLGSIRDLVNYKKKLCPVFLLHLQKQQEHLVVKSANTQESSQIPKVNQYVHSSCNNPVRV
jgi:hypothetical protein